MINLKFLERMKKILSPNEFGDFFHALSQECKKGLVLNTSKLDEKTFENIYNFTKLPYGENCYEISNKSLGADLLHRVGAYYIQEPSAMLPGIVLPIKDGDRVLDVCASPGGKTFQIARRLNGVLVSNEIDYSRAKTLLSNVERLGLTNTIVTFFSSEELAEYYPNKFDCVLIDAPCSGEGMFRKEKHAVEQWSEEYVKICANMQQEIIENVDKTLKGGGYMVYSTCTFSVEENECNVAKLVDMGYEILDMGKIFGASEGVRLDGYNTHLCKRFYFHKSLGEGQFVALLKKNNANVESYRKERAIEPIGKSFKKLVIDFLNKYTDGLAGEVEDSLYIKNDAVFFCPSASFLVRANGVLSYGVKLGNIIKNRFEPCHNLWTAFGNRFNNKVELPLENAERYLRGDTFCSDIDDGWCAVTYLGVVLGGGKAVNGVVKNRYPKGLRK